MIQPAPSSVGVTTAPRFETDLHEETLYTQHPAPPARVMWWSSIIAGAVAAIALQVMFALLGTAIGLSVLGAADDAPEAGLSIGAGIYWLVTGLISLFVGGVIASRFRNTADGSIGAMHGFMAWCSVTVLSALLVAVASGAAIGGSLSVVGDAMAASTRGMQQSARTVMNDISGASNNLENQSNTQSNTAGVANRANIDEDARTITPQERKEAASDAALASWWTLIALVLGATVATVGGRVGIRYAETRTLRTTTHPVARD